jgi:spermidine synthase
MPGPGVWVTVGERLDAAIRWLRNFSGKLNDRPLDDQRVALESGDIVRLITRAKGRFDAIVPDRE